eukprot:7979594-Pyramimonas_sp.AAC.1
MGNNTNNLRRRTVQTCVARHATFVIRGSAVSEALRYTTVDSIMAAVVIRRKTPACSDVVFNVKAAALSAVCRRSND